MFPLCLYKSDLGSEKGLESLFLLFRRGRSTCPSRFARRADRTAPRSTPPDLGHDSALATDPQLLPGYTSLFLSPGPRVYLPSTVLFYITSDPFAGTYIVLWRFLVQYTLSFALQWTCPELYYSYPCFISSVYTPLFFILLFIYFIFFFFISIRHILLLLFLLFCFFFFLRWVLLYFSIFGPCVFIVVILGSVQRGFSVGCLAPFHL